MFLDIWLLGVGVLHIYVRNHVGAQEVYRRAIMWGLERVKLKLGLCPTYVEPI